ncbi:MAG TPA: zinc-binding dehydrogenase [Candidatus Dormibacteraeota bacterium]|nr:zinc-binding dehydrogenase [Candidatus Dormibacteraeota bacterium]
MRALISTPNGPLPAEIQEVDEPSPASGELVLEVRSASLNRGELSLLAARPGWGPGQDVAGVVLEAAADGSGPPEGARAVAVVDQAGWADRVAAPTSRVARLPDGVEFGAGATLGVAGLTALRALRLGGDLLGRDVLVTGASGGVGRFAVQLAAIAGARVTAAVGSADRGEGLEGLGAARTVVGDEDLGGPFDFVMEGVGGGSLERSVHALTPGGGVALFGAVAGEPARLGLADFRGCPGARIQSFFIYSTDVGTFGRDLAFMAGLVAKGKLRPQIGLEVSWRNLGAAVESLRGRRVRGKAILRID